MLTRLKKFVNAPYFGDLVMLISGGYIGIVIGDNEASNKMLLTYLFVRAGFSSSGSPKR